MTICADTSFLFSLYGSDVNTSAAQRCIEDHQMTVHVHLVNTFEFENAVRLRCFQGKFSGVERDTIIDGFRGDIDAGRVVIIELNLTRLFDEAASLSRLHTETLGNRAYDILHVAAAKLLGAKKFWSFDGKQRSLAALEGLDVGP